MMLQTGRADNLLAETADAIHSRIAHIQLRSRLHLRRDNGITFLKKCAISKLTKEDYVFILFESQHNTWSCYAVSI